MRGIDLEIERGEVFAFLGPNGAGKTTTVEILEGFRERSGGAVSVLGSDPADADRAWFVDLAGIRAGLRHSKLSLLALAPIGRGRLRAPIDSR